ncbi:MAG: ABC transporter permease [Acidobacteriota bacterium]|nr:ABC transporter permease [Blastocatellia bacterium]MDW8412980.1 ABC transporter permease [Acidobacteriota bacterium]
MLTPVFEGAHIALDNLRVNKLRTFLTIIGIIIGVAAVISVVTVIDGLNKQVAQTFMTQGSNVFSVRRLPQVILSRDDFLKYNKRKPLTVEDALFLREKCVSCAVVGWDVSTLATVKYGNEKSEGVGIRGISDRVLAIEAVEFDAGRPLTSHEIVSGAKVCIVGWDIVTNLFPGRDPLGKEISISGVGFTIVGVAKRLGTIFGFSRDNFVFIPITAYQRIYGTRQSISILVAAQDTDTVDKTMQEVRIWMRMRRGTSFRDKDDGFSIETSQIFLDLYANATSNIYLVSFIVSGISLVVGGIVVMNIMLVSVTERTREIGIRKACGARRRDILVQFLIEAVVISAVGGVFGIVAGYVLAWLISIYTNFPMAIKTTSAVLGVSVSSLVGIVFGVYPASRAARLDPIEALRAE